MKTTQRYYLAMLLGLALTASACTKDAQSATPEPERPAQAPTNVKVATVKADQLTETVALRGTTQAKRSVTFSAEAAGPIEFLTVELGDKVKPGTILARVDYAMRQAQRDQAQVVHDLAQKTLERLASLRAKDLVSQQRVDEAEAQRLTSKATLDIAEIQLKKADIRSNLHGVVVRKYVERGEFTSPGQPLFEVVDLGTIVVSAQVPERVAPHLKSGQPVNLRVDVLDREYTGTVDVLLPTAVGASGTFELRVTLPNKDRAILVGMAATLRITTQIHEAAVVVAQDVVVESDEGRAVFVERDGQARRRAVTLGAREADKVQILEGLEAGDRLIVEGQRDLHDGAPVRVVADTSTAVDRTPSARPDRHS